MESDLMKKSLLFFYIHESHFVVGTLHQFTWIKINQSSKEELFRQNNLDINKKYICFFWDDISPDDPAYLHDLVKAVIKQQCKGHHLG
jgi:hypothetical protein